MKMLGTSDAMAERYDAIVIGAGVAGEVCAEDLAAAGMRVACCERELVAGECGYWACIPSKTLLRPGEVLSEARQAPGAREAISGPINVREALAWRNFQVSDWDDSHQAGNLTDSGVELRRGEARINGPHEVEIDGKLLETERLVIATGSDPVIPPVDGLDELDGVWTNREATSLREVPGRLIVLGGGPVGVELGQALSRLGASVAIAEGEDRLLPNEAPALGEALEEALSSEGIELRLGAKASSADRRGGGYSLSFEDGSELRGDELLVATGRKPRVQGFGLDTAGIDPEAAAKGIQVDSRMRAAEGVWAIGDVTGIWPFTHVGKYQGRVAAADILGRDVTADYRAVPRVIFTDPQVAAVGEQDGPASGTAQLESISRTSTYSREYDKHPGFLTLVSDGEKLIGAHAVGPEAGEWLQQATLAIKAEIPVETLRQTIQPYPTFSEAFFYALADL
jgi:pyruvate/2-oxoglutarate dehydrogenase complex dihydrolipoamide dehydrogenase (E3) component